MKHIKKFDIFEGKTFQGEKKPYSKKSKGVDRKIDFKETIENHIISLGLKTKEVGNDLEIHKDGEMIAQVMFRNEYVGFKKSGVKFIDEFGYNELGKIKSKITQFIK